jgi:hypothetical protein
MVMNTHTLRNKYKQIRNQASRDAFIGGIILAVIGGLTVALAVRGFCMLVVAIHG